MKIELLKATLLDIENEQLSQTKSILFFIFKRGIDLSFSIGFIILFCWLFPLICLLIKLSSKGSIFFIQKRTGYRGKEFNCYKFRTMIPNSEADTQQALFNDNRITKIGKILRFTQMDELPQLINVLKGDMTIIGPRPHMLYHTQIYSQQLPYYHLRHEVVPGITGMAQIKGFIGEINSVRDLKKRVDWDIYYIKNKGFSLDTEILYLTFVQFFKKAIKIFNEK